MHKIFKNGIEKKKHVSFKHGKKHVENICYISLYW